MSYSRPEKLIFMPWVRCPPWASSIPISVSPGIISAWYAASVGLRAGVGLDVGVLGPEQLLGPVDRQLLGDVDVLAAAVVAPARVPLGVLVGQHRPLALQHRQRDEVLRGDHLERPLLAVQLQRQHLSDLRIDLGQGTLKKSDGRSVLTAGDDTSGGGGALGFATPMRPATQSPGASVPPDCGARWPAANRPAPTAHPPNFDWQEASLVVSVPAAWTQAVSFAARLSSLGRSCRPSSRRRSTSAASGPG